MSKVDFSHNYGARVLTIRLPGLGLESRGEGFERGAYEISGVVRAVQRPGGRSVGG